MGATWWQLVQESRLSVGASWWQLVQGSGHVGWCRLGGSWCRERACTCTSDSVSYSQARQRPCSSKAVLEDAVPDEAVPERAPDAPRELLAAPPPPPPLRIRAAIAAFRYCCSVPPSSGSSSAGMALLLTWGGVVGVSGGACG